MTKRISRRTFIGTTGAAGAGFWITGRQLGYGQEKSPNAKVKWISQWSVSTMGKFPPICMMF